MAVEIDDELFGGNITVIDSDVDAVVVAPEPDPEGDFCQWFAFRSRDVDGDGATVRLDTSGTSWPEALDDYAVFASFDGRAWERIETDRDDEALVFEHPSGVELAEFALWEPYTPARRRRLAARMRRARGAQVVTLGRTVDGSDLDAVHFAGGERRVWIVARQHPGEVMAEWYADGLLERLADLRDPAVKALRALASVTVVSCANLDGSARGHHRVNALGVDMNRAWLDADESRCPEVVAMRAALEQSSVDLFVDVHGDERTARAFVARSEGNPSYDDRLAALEDRFVEALAEACDEFDRESGYPIDAPGEADLRTAANFVGERFDCPSLTLELPFNGAKSGWTSTVARSFGARSLAAVLAVLDE
ncbi:MAG: hypothetical protein JNK05_30285 [Myxococcales bacterium]|nr:hypothetical protein [Myxococcales bacterium]